MNKKDYVLGQILYVASRKEIKLVPCQVIEISTKKTLSGVYTEYYVQTGQDKQRLSIDVIEGDIFESAEDAYKHLSAKAATSIQRLVNNAMTYATSWFENGFEKSGDVVEFVNEQEKQKDNKQETPKENMFFELPDGQKVKVREIKIPDELK